jgi:hypothetical protein
MHTNIHISVSVILRLSLNLGVYCSLEKSDVLRGLLLPEDGSDISVHLQRAL